MFRKRQTAEQKYLNSVTGALQRDADHAYARYPASRFEKGTTEVTRFILGDATAERGTHIPVRSGTRSGIVEVIHIKEAPHVNAVKVHLEGQTIGTDVPNDYHVSLEGGQAIVTPLAEGKLLRPVAPETAGRCIQVAQFLLDEAITYRTSEMVSSPRGEASIH